MRYVSILNAFVQPIHRVAANAKRFTCEYFSATRAWLRTCLPVMDEYAGQWTAIY